MKTYFAFIAYEVKLTFRDRLAMFFSYLFPLLVFCGYNEYARTNTPDQFRYSALFFTMFLTVGALVNGLRGLGLRVANERERNILRRFKVTPISPLPLLTGLIVSGWLVYMPVAIVFGLLAHFRYAMALPAHSVEFLLFLTLGLAAFRSLGLVVASVANSVQEATMMVQFFFLPLLLLSGATIPIGLMPRWAQAIAALTPSYHFLQISQAAFQVRGGADPWKSAGALLVTTVAATFIAFQLFRWDKTHKSPRSAKLLAAAALIPCLLFGCYQVSQGDFGRAEPFLFSKPSHVETWPGRVPHP